MLDVLTLDQLRVAVAIADLGSFSAAARQLRRVQSAISQSVRSIEATLAVRLFDRTLKYPVLTAEGAVVIADARKLLRDAQALRARAEGMAAGLEPQLALAVDPLFPNDVLMCALRKLETSFPTLPVRLVTAGLGVPERHLRDGSVTLAIYSLDTTAAADLAATFLVDIDLVPVVAAEHPLATVPGPIRRDALSEHLQLVLSDMGTGGWTRGVVGPQTWLFGDLHVRLEFLLGGFGWCNMPQHLVAPMLKDGRLVRLHLREQSGFRLPLQAVHLNGKSLGPGALYLVQSLQRLLQQ